MSHSNLQKGENKNIQQLDNSLPHLDINDSENETEKY
jgi:hypothetical protein